MQTFAYEGSVSHGTLREQDLIPAFMGVLEVLNPRVHANILKHHRDDFRLLESVSDPWEWTTPEWESIQWLLHEVLMPALDDVAPEGYRFGAHEGDGADFGFWRLTPEPTDRLFTYTGNALTLTSEDGACSVSVGYHAFDHHDDTVTYAWKVTIDGDVFTGNDLRSGRRVEGVEHNLVRGMSSLLVFLNAWADAMSGGCWPDDGNEALFPYEMWDGFAPYADEMCGVGPSDLGTEE